MRTYELVAVFHSEEEPFKLGKDSVLAELQKHGAVVAKEDDMGDRQLAYEIKKKKRGHYWLYTLQLDSAGIPHIERNFHLNPNLLKFLFVRKEE